MPEISIIIPIYNGEKFLVECVDSVIKQSFKDIEIILVNNKSTDRTAEICNKYAECDDRIVVVHRDVHGWISDGRNDGLSIAKGKWITFIDADDWLSLDHYEKIMNELPDEKIDIYCQGGCVCEYPGKSITKYTGTGNFLYCNKNKIINLAKHIFIPIYKNNSNPINLSAPWDKLYSKEFLFNNNIQFNSNVFFADDSFFNIEAFCHARVVAGTNHIGYHYRQVSTSVTHNYRPDWPEKIYSYLVQLDEYIQTYNLVNELNDARNFTTLRCFLNMLRGYYLNPQNNMSRKEIRNQLKTWKEKKLYKNAIFQKKNNLLSFKLKVFKQILKTDYVFLLEILLWIERKKNAKL